MLLFADTIVSDKTNPVLSRLPPKAFAWAGFCIT